MSTQIRIVLVYGKSWFLLKKVIILNISIINVLLRILDTASKAISPFPPGLI